VKEGDGLVRKIRRSVVSRRVKVKEDRLEEEEGQLHSEGRGGQQRTLIHLTRSPTLPLLPTCSLVLLEEPAQLPLLVLIQVPLARPSSRATALRFEVRLVRLVVCLRVLLTLLVLLRRRERALGVGGLGEGGTAREALERVGHASRVD
jgi:hypothetical protein